jgi:hypothetical protein
MSPDISVELNYRGVTHSSASHFMRSKSIVSGSASASDLDQIHHSIIIIIIIIALTASSFRGACHDRRVVLPGEEYRRGSRRRITFANSSPENSGANVFRVNPVGKSPVRGSGCYVGRRQVA